MPSFLQIADNFDVQPLKKALELHTQLFGLFKQRATAYGSPHTDMTDIWVRYNAISNFDPKNPARFNEEHDPVWYPSYYALPELKSIIFPLMALTDGERLGGVLITKLAPGGEIKPHTDAGWHAGYYEKFYVPIKNGKGSIFGFPEGDVEAKEGCVYWFRNDVTHWVKNNSGEDRIAMIVCIKTDKYKGLRE